MEYCDEHSELEEEIRQSLAGRRSDRARDQVARLARQDPYHRRLHGFLRLLQVSDDRDTLGPGERLRELLAIEPLARELLGHRDRDFLAPLWSALAESLAGRAFASPRFPDRRLAELWNGFGDLEPPLDTEDFPAWLLLQEPTAAVPPAPDSLPPDERGATYRLLQRIVTGDDDIGLRRELAEIHPQLLRLFLTRKIHP